MKQKFLLFFLLVASLISIKAKANESEPNDTRAQANTLTLNGNQSGAIGTSTDVDWYKVTANADGRLDFTLSVSNNEYCWVYLYDNNGTTELKSGYTSGTAVVVSVDGLAAGTYYIKIAPYYSGHQPIYTVSNTLTAATPANDVEPNGTKAQALTLSLNGSKTGHIGYYYNNQRDTSDWYKITTNGDGLIKLKLTSTNTNYVKAYLYDLDGTTQLGYLEASNNTTTTNVDGLAAGTYYVRINAYYDNQFVPYVIADSLFTPAQANDAEPDSTKAQALTLPLNGSKTGHIGYFYNNHRDTSDWYKVTTNGDGLIQLKLTSANSNYVKAYLYDLDGSTQLGYVEAANNTVITSVDGLAAGTYYVRINAYYNNQFVPYVIADSLFKPKQANDVEPNDSKATATAIPVDTTITGHTGYYYSNKRDSSDWYKITLPEDGEVKLTLTSANNYYVKAYLYDNNGTTQLAYVESVSSTPVNVVKDGLAVGTYYVRVSSYYNNQFSPYTLTDSLFTYNANDAEPNKYAKQAKTLLSEKDNSGHVGFYYKNAQDTTDWSKINYTGNDGTMSITLNVLPHLSGSGSLYTWLTIYKDTSAAPLYDNYTTTTLTANFTSLAKGYYYVKVHEYYSSDFAAYSVTPSFRQSKPKIVVSSYDSASACTGDSITYKISGSHSPFTVSLYKFGVLLKKQTTNSTFITFNGLTDGTYYAVAYGDGGTNYAKGISDTLTIMPIPSSLKTSAIGSDHAKLNWKVLSCADTYSIRYRKSGTTTWTNVLVAGTFNFYTVQGLTPSTSYEWQIAATDSTDGTFIKSAFSSSVTFVTTATGFAENNTYENDGLSVNGKQRTIYLGVYPNPASSHFTIHYNTSIKDKMSATLYDVNGKAVWASGALNADALNGKQVNVNQFGSGLYYLKIIDSKGLNIANTKVSITK